MGWSLSSRSLKEEGKRAKQTSVYKVGYVKCQKTLPINNRGGDKEETVSNRGIYVKNCHL